MPHSSLLLVDGTGVAYRAFYAIRELSTADGRPTNAVFGFIKMIHQLGEVWKPTHWAVVFDGGLPRERMSRLPTYKAQRPPMPDDLRGQFEPIEDFLRRSEVPAIRLDGEEADDVMATLAARGRERGMEVVMASSDKDLYQLIGEGVTMVSPSKTGMRMGPAEVAEKTGVPPARVVDWLALTGDSVDNIPGVPGVGEKTAAKLLAQFGSLAELWEKLGEVNPPRIREALQAHREDVARNVELVRLRRDVPLDVDWDAMRVRPPDASRLVPFYRRMEFGSLARALEGEAAMGPLLDFGGPD